jgi:Uncharacterized protein conserved in bacteria
MKNFRQNITRSLMLLLAGITLSFSVFAVDLDEAKARGLVGETLSGYLEVVSGNGEARDLVVEINAKRKAQYKNIAAKNNISLGDVELLAGKKAIEKTPAGQYIKIGGQWQKK